MSSSGPSFSAGDSLLPVQGDPKRQAIASLRGYAYQLYASALAWVSLKSGDTLYLEVAEDYATLVRDTLNAVQVKDTPTSRITINNSYVQEAITGFVDLVELNPSHNVNLRFLTTSEIGLERDTSDRIEGEAVLQYWRRAARAADVAPMRSALLRSTTSDRVRRFINERGDEALRADLLRRIHWDAGACALEGLKEELTAGLIELASDQLGASPRDCIALPDAVVVRVLDAVMRPAPDRRLGKADLLALCEAITSVTVPASTLKGLLSQLASASSGIPASIGAMALLEDVSTYPPLHGALPRQTLTSATRAGLAASGAVFLVGGSGMGKTTAARVAAQSLGGTWLILSLVDRSAQETERLLEVAIGKVAETTLTGLIVDDINEAEAQGVCRRLAQLISALRRRDALCIATAYRALSNRALDSCGVPPETILRVPEFDQGEVDQLVRDAGGNAAKYGRFVRVLSSGGHPQLAKAVIASARRMGWDSLQVGIDTVNAIQGELDTERRRLRSTLMERLDVDDRRLLLRVSLLYGRFPRPLGRALGDVAPTLVMPGELLNGLVGPWIDEVADGDLRVSPLLANAGAEDLSSDEQRVTHACAAKWLSPVNHELDASRVGALYYHSLCGGVEAPLVLIFSAVIAAPAEQHRLIADGLPALLFAETDRPIYPANVTIDRGLRLAQLLLVASSSPGLINATWVALEHAMSASTQDKVDKMFESAVFSKVLLSEALTAAVPHPMRLLGRLFELTSDIPELKDLHSGLEKRPPALALQGGSVANVMFMSICMHIGTVERQRQLFVDLDELGPEAHKQYLPPPDEAAGWVQTAVNAAWLAQANAKTLDPLAASQTFEALEALALKWARADLAVRFRVARAVMHDEYADDQLEAGRLLAPEDSTFGSSPVIARARVRLHFRQRRFQDVLTELERAPHVAHGDDPLERALLHREVAISAAGTGDWRSAADWFARAYRELVDNDRGAPHLRIGLRADAALAGFQAGDVEGQSKEYENVLEMLESLDAEESLGAAYCHRAVRHGLLWMYAESRGRPTGLELGDQAPYLIAGMCTNLEPPEAIRTHNLAHLDATWYLLASVQARYISINVAIAHLRSHLGGREIPSMEVMVSLTFIECAIRTRSAKEFTLAVNRWMDCVAHELPSFDGGHDADLASPAYGSVPKSTESQRQAPYIQQPLSSAVLAFGVMCALAGDGAAIKALESEVRDMPGCAYLIYLLDRMLNEPVAQDATMQDMVASVVRTMTDGTALTPTLTYIATLRCLQACEQPLFRSVIEPAFVAWAKTKWGQLRAQTFALKAVSAVKPAIDAALKLEGLRGLATLLRTTSIGFDVKLGTSMYEWLKKVEGRSAS